jgi:hypothetical protein
MLMSPQRWPNPSTATATWTTSCVSTPMTTCCAKLSSVTCSSELVVASPAAGQTCDGTVRGQAPDKSRPFGDDPCGALARGQILGKATTAPGGSRVTRAKAGPASSQAVQVIDAIGEISDRVFDPYADPSAFRANLSGRAWTSPLNAQKCGKSPNRFVG